MEGKFMVVMLLFGAVAVMGYSPLEDEGIQNISLHNLQTYECNVINNLLS